MPQMSIYGRDGVNALEGRRGSRSSQIDAACERYVALVLEKSPDLTLDDLRALRRAMPSRRPWSVDEVRALPEVLRRAAGLSGAKAANRLNKVAEASEELDFLGRVALVDAAERSA